MPSSNTSGPATDKVNEPRDCPAGELGHLPNKDKPDANQAIARSRGLNNTERQQALTYDRAEQLAKQIRAHWHRLGQPIEISIVQVNFGATPEFIVRSNIKLSVSPEDSR
jgi:hypothetical protein